MSKLNILISGAGIAGPTLAFWLARFGMKSVVVERAPQLRSYGQNIDIRGAGREVVRRMGLADIIKKRTTGELGFAFVDKNNTRRASFGVETFGGGGFTAEIEILRGELATILYDASKNDAEYIFGDYISNIVEQGDRVVVSFTKGATREFDLVVAADGMRSKTRNMVMGGESPIRSLGQYTAYFTIPRNESDENWARWYNAVRGRSVILRPDNHGNTHALLAFMSPPIEYEKLDINGQKQLIHKVFADAGWEAPRILSAMNDTPDFYLQEVGQVKMERWSKGRVAFVGDAGYCPSPISGMGTTLGMVGAYILAGELASHGNYIDAFNSYEAIMRPIVKKAQSLIPGAPRIANPNTQLGISVLHTILKLATRSSKFSKYFGKIMPQDSITLPTYDIK